MAADVFKRKFASKIITFNSASEKSIHEAVLICDYKTLTLTLQQFGHLIEKIEISYDDIEVDQHKEISELLLKHCSDSLASMEIIQWETNALWNFEDPFKNVNILTIHGDPKLKSPKFFHIFSKKPMKLNEIFPSIRQLNLLNMFVSNPLDFGVEIPRLNHVNIVFFPAPFNEPLVDYFSKTKPAIKKLFENNQQIRNLSLINCNSLDFLKMASDLLPNLVELHVNLVSLREHIDEIPFDFPNVKKLQVKMSKRIDLFNTVAFGRLEELDLNCSGFKCKTIPVEHSRLKKLQVSGFMLEYGKLLEFNEKTPNLEELFIASDSKIDANAIVEYLRNNINLRKLRFVSSDQVLYDVLSKWIHGWILSIDDNVVTLEKQR